MPNLVKESSMHTYTPDPRPTAKLQMPFEANKTKLRKNLNSLNVVDSCWGGMIEHPKRT